MLLTRGCPSRCTFCGAGLVNGYNLRARSVNNILTEIKLLVNTYGVKEIHFFDSNCSHRKGPLREVCKRIISEKIDITWCAPNGIRIDSIDKELAGLMKKSGCFQVNVGIETGSPRVMLQIKKGISLDMVRANIAILRKAGIEVTGFFVMGFPGEKRREINQTINTALQLPLTGASFSILTPLDSPRPDGLKVFHDSHGRMPSSQASGSLAESALLACRTHPFSLLPPSG